MSTKPSDKLTDICVLEKGENYGCMAKSRWWIRGCSSAELKVNGRILDIQQQYLAGRL